MLNEDEIKSVAKTFNLKPWQAEKQYLQATVLTILSETQITFKGGTYLWFFHNLRRFSEDLDFTSDSPIDKEFAETVSKKLEDFGFENSIKKIESKDESYSFRISAKGPLTTSNIDLCHIYVEISKREKIIKPTIPCRLEMDAYKLPIKTIAGMNLDEVGAEKIRAIMTRDKCRDIYDLFFLINKKNITFDKKLVNEKIKYYQKKYSRDKFVDIIVSRKKDWEIELKPLIFDRLPVFDEVVLDIKNWIEK